MVQAIMKDLAIARCIVSVRQFAQRNQREFYCKDESRVPSHFVTGLIDESESVRRKGARAWDVGRRPKADQCVLH